MQKQTIQNLNLIGDCLVLVCASAVATKVPGQDRWHWMVFLGMSTGSLLLWTLGGRILRHYDVWNGRGRRSDIALTLLLIGSVLIVMALLQALVPAYGGAHFPRFIAVMAPALVWMRLTTSWMAHRDVPVQPILIIGTGPLGRHTGLEIRAREDHRRIVGYLRFADEEIHDRLPAELLGKVSDLEELLKTQVVGEVFIAGHNDPQRTEMQSAIRVLEQFGIPFALPAAGFRFGRARPEYRRAVADGYIHYLSVRHRPLQRAVKRLFDIVASAGALVLLAPLVVAVAIAIGLTSRGPILFRPPRVGQHGHLFHMLKFRSMVANAEQLKAKLMALNERSGPVFKMLHDPRITAI